ncbi:MAG: lysine--tRNA ligase [Alphaproteobacteria bacterium]
MTDIDITPEIANQSRAWPFEEAKQVVKRLRALNKGQITAGEKGYVLFETGYGPSGLPHIGTFGEVARTSMVMQAFKTLHPEIPVKLICFSDDMDGFRKVPSNVPQQEMLAEHLNKPLTQVPNPFDTEYESYADHNNAQLRAFLDGFGFEYEFYSGTECYKSGKFNAALRLMLEKHEEIKGAVLPILGEERAASYSPFLPISPKTGNVLQVPVLETDPEAGTITFEDEDGEGTTIPVTDGHVKAQWRADWALRWFALDVDYEMAGKDLVSSADISAKIVQILGSRGPAGFRYEMFLDEKGEKISKSKGNGLSMEDWLAYAPHESLAYYMYQRPTSAKKLYFDVIPKAVDEYITFVGKLAEQEGKQKLENPAWYIHPPSPDGFGVASSPVSFNLLLNLVNAANTEDPAVLWSFIQAYAPEATPESAPFLDRLVGFAIRYYKDFVLPQKVYRAADAREAAALGALAGVLEGMDAGLEAEDYMTEVFSAGKENGYEKDELRDWFKAIYEICLGQSQGPRFGSFIQLYGVKETAALIRDALDGKFSKAA